ncbi:hypothetical protein COCNU_05G002450 [Cocos nucifera]|uniref:Uncharacterized protein n=1 Tax=Cocos nucifera TaxID=13894 RepID=A0A8K0I8E2_COCNU|nr:hypothetical protein COCNU_05G002450 [Cocos nucifera]
MDDVWSWLILLPSPSKWPSSPPSLVLAASADRSILLSADRTAGSNAEALATFSISLHGFPHPSNPVRTLWVSEPFPLSSPSSSRLLFLLQLLHEVIALSPSTSSLHFDPASIKLDTERISDAIAGAGDEAAVFFALALLLRLFWLCACDAPADAGFLFFRSLGPALERALDCRRALREFLLAAGPDAEERFMRSLGYMLAKWCLLRELQPAAGRRLPATCCPSYAAEAHGLWVLKGFAPVSAMAPVGTGSFSTHLEAKGAVLRYAMAHQQLEAVVQLEYTVCMRDPRFIKIGVRVDNIRLHVVRLRFGRKNEGEESDDVEDERHFPSRVRLWVGPEAGSAYATGPSLGRSSGNPEREVETVRTITGRFGGGGSKAPGIKAKARASARSRGRSWRWEQEAEGGAGVFDGVLCDASTGAEVAGWRPAGGGGAGGGGDPRGGMRRRYSGSGRAFSKAGGVVVAGDELAEGVSWRVGREMEGRVVRWRIGGRLWVSYFPNEVKTSYYETRCVEWREEVELALVAGGEGTRT